LTVQLHDYNPGIAANGLFWTARVPDSVMTRNDDGSVRVVIEDLEVVDTFFLFSGVEVPGVVSYDITWTPTGEVRHLRPGDSGPMDPTHVHGQFRDALAVGSFAGTSVTMPGGEPFSFEGDASTAFAWGEMGTMRNGWFIKKGRGSMREVSD
jgi:hypothetical protein